MSVTNIAPTKLKLNEAGSLTFTAPTAAADGFAVNYGEQDSKLVLLLQNTDSAAATAIIKAGDGIQGVVDYTQSLPAGSVSAIRLESGKFKRVTGDNRGSVIVIPSSVKVLAALTLIP